MNTFASILARCQKSAGGAAAFDYALVAEPDEAGDILGWAIRDEAAHRLGTSDIFSAEVSALRGQLRAEIAADVEARIEQARTRKYTGWSKRSTGPIRYAEEA
jgi:hypothetical protein